MKITIAENAGFCFGVKRAMKLAWDELIKAKGKDVYAYGPLIHNKQAVGKYEERGLITAGCMEDIPDNVNIIMRSHGVHKNIYDEAEARGMKIVDTTCPFVKKIHKIVNEKNANEYKIIIIGDKEHPEVHGINGWCEDKATIIKTVEEAEKIQINPDEKYCLVSQTTMNLEVYGEMVDILLSKNSDIEINNTICSATKERQESAAKLAKEVECMVVIGGKHSSNTQKLVGICKEICPTFAIEVKEDLDVNEIKKYENIGITAGASTPDWIMEDIIGYLNSL